MSEPYAGNEAIVWTFSSLPFSFLPGVNLSNTPMVADITFNYIPVEAGTKPDALSWIQTSGVSDIPFSWDADVKVYKATSVAGDTTVEAYFAKSEVRELSSAIAGDYYATGNSLMLGTYPTENHRDLLLATGSDVTSANSGIPDDARVEMAYLYWSGWVPNYANGIFWDNCGNLSSTDPNYCKFSKYGSWEIETNGSGKGGSFYERFRGHGDGSSLTIKSNLDLSQVSAATIQWDQAALANSSTDQLRYQLSNNGGLTWSAPTVALQGNHPPPSSGYPPTFQVSLPHSPVNYYTDKFRIRFILSGFDGSGEYAYIDNILVTDDTVTSHYDAGVTFEVNTNDGTNKQFRTPLAADPTDPKDKVWAAETVSTPVNDGWYYACRKNVTDLVKEHSNGADLSDPLSPVYGNGKAVYTLGDVYAGNKSVKDPGFLGASSYAGWSIIIVYSSPAESGHQLYLFEDMTSVPFQQPNGDPMVIMKSMGGFMVPQPITGDVDAARITAFVGEGDLAIKNDYAALIDQRNSPEQVLWDGVSCDGNSSGNPKNVWNSYCGDSADPSSGSSLASGVDIDTFHVPWGSPPESGVLRPGDTSAQIKLYTNGDGYVLVYIILSFRSETVTGGNFVYLIK